jgi:hypothetical protein
VFTLLRFVTSVTLAAAAVLLAVGPAQADSFALTGSSSYTRTFFTTPNQITVTGVNDSASAELTIGSPVREQLATLAVTAGEHPAPDYFTCSADALPSADDVVDVAVTYGSTTLHFAFAIAVRWVCNLQAMLDITLPAAQTIDAGPSGTLTVTPYNYDPYASGHPQVIRGQWRAGTTLSAPVQFSVALSAPGEVVDLTDPMVSCGAAPVFLLGQPGAMVGATVSDDGSGAVAPTVSVPADTSVVGRHTVPVTGQDKAGRTTTVQCAYTVAYRWTGFLAPVDVGLNTAKAGQAIPLKWRLTDFAGAPVTTLTAASLTAVTLPCAAGVTGDQVEEYAAGASGLQNLGNGYYQLNWKTPAGYAGSCKTARLALGDDSVHTADVSFRR